MKSCFAVLVLGLVVSMIGCGNGDETSTVPQDAAANYRAKPQKPPGQYAHIAPHTYRQEGPFAAIAVKAGSQGVEIDPPARPAPAKFLVRDLEMGSGPPVRRGDEISVHYTGALYETGEVVFGQTTQFFELGSGGLGDTFERGIEGMRLGGRRELVIPSRLHGGTGDYDYVIELTGLAGQRSSPGRHVVIAGEGKFAKITFFPGDRQPRMQPSDSAPPRKVLSRDLRVGSGEVAHRGDRLKLYYYSVTYKTGKRSYFRWPPQRPLSIKLGTSHWEKPLTGMRVGGRREVVVPSYLLFKAGTVDYIWELRRVG